MMKNIYTRTLHDKRWFALGWMISFFALSALMVAFFPSMKQQGSLDQFVMSLPPAFQGFVGDLANLKSFAPYLASQLFDIRMQIIGGIMAVVLAISLTAGEESTGQFRSILSLPVSRVKLLLHKWLAMITIIGGIIAASALGVFVTQFTIGESIQLDVLLRLEIMSWLLLVALASIPFAVGIGSGNKALATLIGTLTVAASFIVTTFAQGVDWLKDYEAWSIFYYFPAVSVVKDGIDLRDVVTLCLIMLVPLVIAWFLFRRRDIEG